MTDQVVVVIAATHASWAARLTRWIRDHASAVRLRDHYLLTREDALCEDYDTLVVDADAALLDAALVAELHRRGRSVVGLWSAAQPTGRVQLHDAGVDRELDDGADPAAVVAAICEVARTRRDFRRVVEGLDPGEPGEAALPPPEGVGEDQGQVTAVAGAHGGVGATELAVETAVALRRRGASVAVVDADVVAPCLAQRLATPPEANLHTAIDAVVHRSGLLADAAATPAVGGFELIAGVRTWEELDSRDVLAVLRALAAARDHVVVDLAACLEDLPGDRHAVTRLVLAAAADRVLLAADATPVGVERACRWLADAADLIDPARVHVALTRCASRDAYAQLAGELERTAAVAGVWPLPADARVPQAAWRAEACPPGRYTRAVAVLADAAIPPARPARRRLLSFGRSR